MPTLAERIEATYEAAIRSREAMFNHRAVVQGREAAAKLEHADEWASAKNNDVRAVLLAAWLADDLVYQQRRGDYEDARDTYRLTLLEIDRLKLLVELEKADATRYAG